MNPPQRTHEQIMKEAQLHMPGTVLVQAFMKPDKELFIRVSLFSALKPNLSSRDDVNPKDHDNLDKYIETLGGALAEHQNRSFNDKHDPSQIAKLARDAFNELTDELNKKSGNNSIAAMQDS